jgi:hypothetical protein
MNFMSRARLQNQFRPQRLAPPSASLCHHRNDEAVPQISFKHVYSVSKWEAQPSVSAQTIGQITARIRTTWGTSTLTGCQASLPSFSLISKQILSASK